MSILMPPTTCQYLAGVLCAAYELGATVTVSNEVSPDIIASLQVHVDVAVNGTKIMTVHIWESLRGDCTRAYIQRHDDDGDSRVVDNPVDYAFVLSAHICPLRDLL